MTSILEVSNFKFTSQPTSWTSRGSHPEGVPQTNKYQILPLFNYYLYVAFLFDDKKTKVIFFPTRHP